MAGNEPAPKAARQARRIAALRFQCALILTILAATGGFASLSWAAPRKGAKTPPPPPAPPPVLRDFSLEEARDHNLRSIGSLKITNRRGAIRIQGWALDKIRIRGTRVVQAASQREADHLLSTADFHYREREGRIEVEAEYGRGLDIRERIQERKDPRVRLDLEITAPSNLALELWSVDGQVEVRSWRASVEVRNSAGAVALDRISGDKVHVICAACSVRMDEIEGSVRIVGGDSPVRMRQVAGRDVYVETAAGDIDLGGVSGRQIFVTGNGAIIGRGLRGSVEFQTRAGGVDMAKSSGQVSGRTGKGDIRIEMLEWNPSGRALIESEKGSIELTLPSAFSSEVDIQSLSGSAKVEFPVRKGKYQEIYGPSPSSHLFGWVGAGGPLLKILSREGNVSVLRGSGFASRSSERSLGDRDKGRDEHEKGDDR